LIRLQFAQDVWAAKTSEGDLGTIDEPISGGFALLHLAMDAAGIPAKGTQANPPSLSCRFRIVVLYLLMVHKHADVDGFMEFLTGKRALPDTWATGDSLEEKLYPRS
jgi:hypothetical protein